jgi:hypothetical protein
MHPSRKSFLSWDARRSHERRRVGETTATAEFRRKIFTRYADKFAQAIQYLAEPYRATYPLQDGFSNHK